MITRMFEAALWWFLQFAAVVLILFLAAIAHAAPYDRVSLVFDRVPVMELARIVFGEIAREPYIFSPDVLTSGEVVSIVLRDIDKPKAIAQVTELLGVSGIAIERRGGVVWIGKRKEEAEAEIVYRPRYRSVSYLVDLLSPLFKQGAFGQQRGIAQGQPLNYVQQPLRQGQQELQRVQPMDTGTSAYSMIDKAPDTVVFKGSRKDIARFEKIVAEVDTATPELLVKAVVFEVSTDSSDRSAMALAVNILGGKLGIKAGKATAGDWSIVLQQASFSAVYDALSSDSRFRAVTTPTLRVKSGGNARLMVGRDTPILGAIQFDANGRSTQSVEYKPSGVILDLKPQVREDIADLQISQQISDFILTTTGVNNSPTLVKRELSTSVGIRSDDVLVLGGLDEEKAASDSSGLSFLPSFLRASGSAKQKTEVLLLLNAQRI